MSSEAEFGGVHEADSEDSQASEQSSTLSFMAATWDHYGGKYVAVCTVVVNKKFPFRSIERSFQHTAGLVLTLFQVTIQLFNAECACVAGAGY